MRIIVWDEQTDDIELVRLSTVEDAMPYLPLDYLVIESGDGMLVPQLIAVDHEKGDVFADDVDIINTPTSTITAMILENYINSKEEPV